MVTPVGAASSAKSTPVATGSEASTAEKSATLNYESFLKLLVAQMKNQDPTEPMDSTQYVAQLATFSQVEQTVQSNAKLEQILQSSALSQADSIIGRAITSADGNTSGTVAEVRLASNGLIAVLANGEEVTVGPGVTVKPAA
jgi:flagellar basal-body rod modification protein FlgD